MKHLSAILAVAILLTVGLACSDGEKTTTTTNGGANAANNTTTASKTDAASSSDATVESVTMKNGEDDEVTVFKTTDAKQKFDVKFSETGVGKVKGVFTTINAGGEKNFKIMEKEVELGTLLNTATFSLEMDKGFPAGDYKLDVFLNGKLVKTQNYKVQ